MSKKKILIATPIHTDNLIMQYVTSVFQIVNNKSTPFEVNVFWRRGSLVNRGRNELVGYFLESEYEYIFFIDSDIVNFVDSFYQIASSYIELEKRNRLLVLGAIYPIKHFNFEYLENGAQIKEENWQQIMLNYNVNIKNLGVKNNLIIDEADKKNGFIESESIGGGFMMFSRYVINKMIENYPESAYKNFQNETLVAKKNYNLFHSFVNPDSKHYLSEDYGFCYNFKKIGGLILSNIKIKLSHYGEQVFNGSLYETLKLRSIHEENIFVEKLQENHIIRNKEDFRNTCNKNLELIRNITIPDIPKESYYETIYVEFREFTHAEFLIRNTIIKLPNWAHTVICGINNFENITEICNSISSNIRIVKLDIDNLNISEYNTLLMSKEFWKNFKGEKLLLYQEDSYLFHNNIAPFLEYDYIGAPWPLNQDEHVNQKEYGVGNGGFSLRTKSKMIECIEKVDWEKDLKLGPILEEYINRIFKDYYVIIPEDVYFSKSLLEKNIGKVAPRDIALNFSQETQESANPLGGHNFFLANQKLNVGIIRNTKRVGVFSPIPFTRGGGEKYLSDIMNFFLNLNYEIYFFNDTFINELKNTLDIFSIDYRKINICKIKSLSNISRNAGSAFFDYFIEMSNSITPSISKVIKQLTYKYIFHCQFPDNISSTDLNKIKRSTKYIDKVIVNSDFTSKYLKPYYNNKLEILYPLCFLKNNSKKKMEDHDLSCVHFVTIGRLFKYRRTSNCKNIDLILDIFNHFALNTETNFKLHIICSVKDINFYDSLVNLYKKSIDLNKVIFYPDCDDSVKEDILTKSNYYIHAVGIRNKKDTFPEEEEHFGISVIEAMCKKCIPIVADRGFPSYLISHNINGYVFDNKKELHDIILDVLCNKNNNIKNIDTISVLENNEKIANKYSNVSNYNSNFLKILYNM